MMSDKLIDLVLSTLNQMGVTLVNINLDNSEAPEFYVELDKSKLLDSEDETLKFTHRILWSLTYGKVIEENKNSEIQLKYRFKESEETRADN